MFIGATDGSAIASSMRKFLSLTDMYGSILIAGAMGYGLNLGCSHRTHWFTGRANSPFEKNRGHHANAKTAALVLLGASTANAACDKMERSPPVGCRSCRRPPITSRWRRNSSEGLHRDRSTKMEAPNCDHRRPDRRARRLRRPVLLGIAMIAESKFPAS
jgi:hypothetical protein